MASPDRPTGEVTFLFTDIEGSTKLVESLGTTAWRPAPVVIARTKAEGAALPFPQGVRYALGEAAWDEGDTARAT